MVCSLSNSPSRTYMWLTYSYVLTVSDLYVKLNGSQRICRTDDGLLTAELLGDLMNYASMPALNEKILMVPPEPASRDSWLLLDGHMVTLSGDECDKVGVGFSAFRSQSSRCYRSPGACLRNQIADILEQERARVASGRHPLYLLSRYTSDGAARTLRSITGGVNLALPVLAGANSMFTLTLDAEDLVQTVNTSPGEIVRAIVTGFTAESWTGGNETSASAFDGGFEALTGSGRIRAEVVNTGHIPAEYHISLSLCTSGVARVIAPGPVTLLPAQPQVLVMRVDVDSHDENLSRSCTLVLQNALGMELDTRVILFYTNATVLDSAPNDVYVPNPKSTFDGSNAERTKLTCADKCPSTMSTATTLCYN